jgi:hypothetical protein
LPSSLTPEVVRDKMAARLPGLADELIDDCSHYTIVFEKRCVGVVTDRFIHSQVVQR